MQAPATKYAEREGVSIAYQVVGDGPFDLVMAPGFISHLDLQWTEPRFAGFLSRLASFSRLIIFDKPGTGLSDPIPHIPTLEERAADIEAVMGAAGSEHAALLGVSESGPAAVLLAATRPERITALVLCGTFPVTVMRAPEAFSPELLAASTATLAHLVEAFGRWGEGDALQVFAPSLTGGALKTFYATFARASASPRMARALIQALARIDVREILPSVRQRTLVVHHIGDEAVPIEAGRLLAAGIPGATMVELEGRDHAFWFGDWRLVADEIERFLTGTTPVIAPDRVLATVLFTDVVGSTEEASRLGDQAWREVLERHDALAREHVEHQGGRIVKHMGDGLLATFDGPARAVGAAEALLAAVEPLGIRLRAGIHTGEVELISDDVGGMAVHIGARVGALAGPGEILVSSTVRDLVVGSQLRFAERGEHELKGIPGRWRVYAVGEERDPAPEPLDAPGDHMRRGDRLAVSLARRAPRMMRFGAKAIVR